MDELNITIHRHEDVLHLSEGFPDHLGIIGASLYVAFIYTNVQVVLWVTDPLSESERKTVSHAVLNLVKHRSGFNNRGASSETLH